MLRLILTVILSGWCTAASATVTVNDSLMNVLEQVIENRPQYYKEKTSRIESLRQKADSATVLQEKYDILDALFNEYHSFNTDSAYAISNRQATLAMRMDDLRMVQNAKLHKADILNATGMYHEALSVLDSLDVNQLPDYLHPYYYHINRTLYGYLADYAGFEGERQRYRAITDSCRMMLMEVNGPETFSHTLIQADQYNEHGEPDKALALLNHYLSTHDRNEHERAVMAWTMSESYRLIGDTERRKEQLLKSSIADLRTAVREYLSLRELALMLYEEGDLDRAYRFLAIALEDANACNARQRILELNKSYPAITRIYLNQVHEQKQHLTLTLALLALLILLLAITLMLMRREMIRRQKAHRMIERNNAMLNELNEQLSASNHKLKEAAEAIAENSALKEVYIGRYMDQCLSYIEKLDSFRKNIGKMAASGKNDDLKRLTSSSTTIDKEFKQFYSTFDKTFLDMFPTFVQDLNALLRPEEAIIPKHPDSLTSELRVYALIRLGIHDSERIAKFLRFSLTTIYNYRTKIRNKAAGDRNSLETAVMRIGAARNQE